MSIRIRRTPRPLTRAQMADRDAREFGRHSAEHLVHDTRDENITARLAIDKRVDWELRHHEAFHRVGRDPWTEYGVPRHACAVETSFLGAPVEIDPDLPPNVIRFVDGRTKTVLGEIKL